MRVICCACGIHMGEKPADNMPPEAISHGLCKPCANNFLAQAGMSLGEYLKNIPVPVVAVSPECTVGIANPKALELLGKEPAEIQGFRGGDVFECKYATHPQGCGETVHCSGCTIRNTVMDTMYTGDSHEHVPAYLNRRVPNGTRQLELLISTEKKGGVVLLKIEHAKDAPEEN